MFQSTHPHGVRLVRQIVIMTYESVSIHAPTRGATLHGSVLRRGIRVSIHAPTRGATLCKAERQWTWMLFQSTHPHGVRLHVVGDDRGESVVSIHAPTRGATVHNGVITVSIYRFNPRTHTGCDIIFSFHLFVRAVSIHAPTRGATFISLIINNLNCFNPRTHTGCDGP